MLVYIFLFFALPTIGLVALILFVGERSTDRSLHPPPTAPSGANLRPH